MYQLHIILCGIKLRLNSKGLKRCVVCIWLDMTEALHGMEAVAEHINEMQKIYEEYGRTFDELAKQYRDIYPHSKVLLLPSVYYAVSK